jgi:hypothetical protein
MTNRTGAAIVGIVAEGVLVPRFAATTTTTKEDEHAPG